MMPATRSRFGAISVWEGTANDVTVRFETIDPDLELFVVPLLTDHIEGVRLVDAEGQDYAWQTRVR